MGKGADAMLPLISFLFVLGLLIMVHETGHFIVARRRGVRVLRFSFGFGPELFGIDRGSTRYSVCAIPLGGYVKLAGETQDEVRTNAEWEFLSKPAIDRFKIVIAGPLLNYILAYFILVFILVAGSPTLTTKVGGLLDDFPAKSSGIEKGDRIVSVNGERVSYWPDLVDRVHNRPNERLSLVIDRAGQHLQIEIVPKLKETKDIFGRTIKLGLLGLVPSEEVVKAKYGPIRALGLAAGHLFRLTQITYLGLWRIVTGGLSIKDSVTGPIGIFFLTGQAAKSGLVYLFQLIAVISASLAIFNLLPLPILDGGHIFFILLEKLRRRPLSARAQAIVTQIGLYILITLMATAVYSDVLRFGLWDKFATWWGSLGLGQR